MEQGNGGISQPIRGDQWFASQVSRPLSKTSILHARQREEQSQQTINEMIAFTEQLLVLPEQIYYAGIADQKAEALRDAMVAFTDLADALWQALATKTLDRVALTQEYRQKAVAVSRRITRMQQEIAQTQPSVNNQGKAILKKPMFWTLRTQWYLTALIRWRDALSTTDSPGDIFPDAGQLTQAIGALRASVGAARLDTIFIFLTRSVFSIALLAGVLIMLGFVALASAALFAGITGDVQPFSIAAGTMLIAWLFTIWLAFLRDDAYFELAGIAAWTPFEKDLTASSVIARIWLWVVSDIGGAVWLLFVGLQIQQIVQRRDIFTQIHDLTSFLYYFRMAFESDFINIFIGSMFFVLISLISLQVIRQIALFGKLIQQPAIQSSARRMYVLAGIGNLIPLLLVLLAGGIYLFSLHGIPVYTIYRDYRISPVSLWVVFLTALTYLSVIEIPYRIGIARWKQQVITLLSRQKIEIERRVDQQEHSGETIPDLEVMQVSVARMQYLQMREKDIKQEPLSIIPLILLVGLIVFFALLAMGIDIIVHLVH